MFDPKMLKPGLEVPPARMQALPIDRGYPVPWFVAILEDGTPEFRCADPEKRVRAIKEGRCWVCGEKLGRHLIFVIGPMCGLNRTTVEPPSHRECALYSVKNCPFLSKPQMVRREGGLPEGTINPAGEMIERNPGVMLLWTTHSYSLFGDGRGGVLIHLSDPVKMEWYKEGRPATQEEVRESVETGLPLLMQMAEQEGAEAVEEMYRRKAWLEARYPS